MRAVQSQPLSKILRLTVIVASRHIFCTICFAVLLFVSLCTYVAIFGCSGREYRTGDVSVYFTEPVGLDWMTEMTTSFCLTTRAITEWVRLPVWIWHRRPQLIINNMHVHKPVQCTQLLQFKFKMHDTIHIQLEILFKMGHERQGFTPAYKLLQCMTPTRASHTHPKQP